MRNIVLLLIGLSGLLLSSAAMAAEPRRGIDYAIVVPPQPTTKDGIEIVEFFSWGCPHCNDLHPALNRWVQALPKGTKFKRVPIAFGRPQWSALAKLYYALQITGDLARFDDELFAAIHERRERIDDEASILAWAGRHGLDTRRLTEVYRSFDVQVKSDRAQQMGKAYGLSGVPTLAVGGKYRVEATDHRQTLEIARGLIDLVRKDP